MKTKHGCLVKVLSFIASVFTALLITFCCHSCMTASAETITLNVAQTLALYGTSFSAVCRYNNGMTSANLDFTYVGNTYDWIKHHESGLMIPFKDPIYEYVYGQGWQQWSHFSNGLIYAAPWNVSGQDFPTSNDSTNVNFYLNQSIPLSTISRYRQYVFWSGFVDSSGSMIGPQVSFCQYMSTFTGTKKFTALNNQASQGYRRKYSYGIWPSYDLNTVADDTEIEGWLANMYGVYTDMNAGSNATFDITSCEYNLNGMTTVDGARIIPPVGGINDKWLFVIITCPQLDATDFVGPTMPPTTTATTQTTQATQISGYTGETVSGSFTTGIGLDDISTDLAEIIRNQRWQIQQNDVMIQNGRRTNDNLSIIIEQLNRIYANMLANGEISPELVPAARLDTIPADIVAQVGTALRGTWPTMPANAFGEAPAVYAEFFNLFREPPFNILFSLGVFGLALSVAGWFLFKGRN